MKILAKKVDMLSSTMEDEKPHPIRFRIRKKDSEEKMVIRVQKVISIDTSKTAGKLSYVYRCQSEINGLLRDYELKYKISDCQWELYKM